MQSCWSSSRLILSKLGSRTHSPKDITLGTRSYQSSTVHDRWSSSELLLSSVVSIVVTGTLIAFGSKDSMTTCSMSTTSSWSPTSSSHFMRYERPLSEPENESSNVSEAVSLSNNPSFEVRFKL
jgi:hypothetical protein